MILRICDKRSGQQLACFALPKSTTFKDLEHIRDKILKRFGKGVSVRVML